MDQNEKVIFAELRREFFELIVETLRKQFPDLKHGSQGDDWIWIERHGMKIEIDSFYSSELEVKGPRRAYGLVKEIMHLMSDEWILKKYDKPKVDLTV
jgi:hypothetical protein